MWSPNNLKRLQTDTDGDCQHIFLEKRQRALRKKRKKVSAPNSEQYNLGNSHPSSLVSLPGISKKRLTRKLGSLSNGVQGSVPAIRKVQQRLDQDLEHRRIDLNSFKGPPVYRNLPKPAIFEEVDPKTRECVRDQPIFAPQGRSRPTHRGNASSRDSSRARSRDSLRGKSRDSSIDPEMERVFRQINEKLATTISQTWPSVSYEDRLQATLNKQITERFAARAMRQTPPRVREKESIEKEEEHESRGSGSGSSSTTLSKPFSSWYINGETESASDFNKSFCRTIKRTFFKPPQNSPDQDHRVTSSHNNVTSSNPTHVTSPTYEMYESAVNVSASALDLFKTQPKLGTTLDSSRGSATDFLDTITDGYDPYNYHIPDTPASQPDLVVRGVKKDFIDVVDNLYHDEIMKEQYQHSSLSKPLVTSLRKQPISDLYSSHVINHKSMRDQYFHSNKENKDPSGGRKRVQKNKQFYLKKEWLK